MAINGLDISQVAIGGVQDDNNHTAPSRTVTPTSPSSDSSRLVPAISSGHSAPPTDGDRFPSLPTPIRFSVTTSPDVSNSPTLYASDASPMQPFPSPIFSGHSSRSIQPTSSTVLRSNNPEGHESMLSIHLLAPPPGCRRSNGGTGTLSSVGGSSTQCEVEDSQSFGLSTMRSIQPDITSTLLFPTSTHIDVASPDDPSCPSSEVSLSKKTSHHVRWPSLPHSDETDTGPNITRKSR
jgi:hypothetical protein